MYEYIADDLAEIADRDLDSGHDVEYDDISEVLHSGEAASLVGGDSLDRAACSNKQALPPKWIGNTRRQELFRTLPILVSPPFVKENMPVQNSPHGRVEGHLESTAPQATCSLQRMCPPFQATEQSRDS